MALPLAAALIMAGARTAAGAAVRRYGATAALAGSKYAAKALDKGKALADDAVGAAKSYFKKPEAPSKPDFVVDSAGNASKVGAKAPAAPAAKPNSTISVDSAGVARKPNYPLATQGSRELTVAGKKTIDPKYASGSTPFKSALKRTQDLAMSTGVAEAAIEARQATQSKATIDTGSDTGSEVPSKPAASVKVLGGGRTTRVGSAVKATTEPEKAPTPSVAVHGNSQSVQGMGNMDTPQADPQFDAEMKNYEDYKAEGGDGANIPAFNAWKKAKGRDRITPQP